MDKSKLRRGDYVYMAVDFRRVIWLYKVRLDRQYDNGSWGAYYPDGHYTVAKLDDIDHRTATRTSPEIIELEKS